MNPNWFALLMQGLTMAPGLIDHFRKSAESGATKQTKVLDGVVTAVGALDSLAPQVLAHPQVRAALKTASDAIYYAGQVAQAVGDKTPVPAPPKTLPHLAKDRASIIWGDVPGLNTVSTSRAGEVAECGDSTADGDPVTDCQAAILGL